MFHKSLGIIGIALLLGCEMPTDGPGVPADSAIALPGTLEGPEWQVTQIAGLDDLPAGRVTIQFGADGRVSGRGGCNGYFGSFTRDGNALELGLMAMTEMACPGQAMAIESEFHQVLGQITGYHFTADEGLVLTGVDGVLVQAEKG